MVTRTAVVQDWFFAPGGSEEVAIELAGLLPGSEVITSFMEPVYRERLAGHSIRTWPLQRVFGPTKRYRSFLPLYPLWFGGLDLRDRDLVISNSTAFAKAVRTRPGARSSSPARRAPRSARTFSEAARARANWASRERRPRKALVISTPP